MREPDFVEIEKAGVKSGLSLTKFMISYTLMVCKDGGSGIAS
jgi:hypothetical protein